MSYDIGNTDISELENENRNDILEIRERLTVVETNVDILKGDCEEILLNQKNNSNDMAEIKSMLKQHIREQVHIVDSVSDINKRIDIQIKPVLDDYTEKVVFLEKLEKFMDSKLFKVLVAGLITLLSFIAFRV